MSDDLDELHADLNEAEGRWFRAKRRTWCAAIIFLATVAPTLLFAIFHDKLAFTYDTVTKSMGALVIPNIVSLWYCNRCGLRTNRARGEFETLREQLNRLEAEEDSNPPVPEGPAI